MSIKSIERESSFVPVVKVLPDTKIQKVGSSEKLNTSSSVFQQKLPEITALHKEVSKLRLKVGQLQTEVNQISKNQNTINRALENILALHPLSQASRPSMGQPVTSSFGREEGMNDNFNIAMRYFENGYYFVGLNYYGKQHFSAAIDMLSKVPVSNSNFEDAQFVSGLCYVQKREIANAANCFANVTETHHSFSDNQAYLGRFCYQQKNYSMAVDHLNRVPESNENYAGVQICLAHCFMALKDYSKARESLDKVPKSHAYSAAAQDLLKKIQEIENWYTQPRVFEVHNLKS